MDVRVTDAETGWSLDFDTVATIPGLVLEDEPFPPEGMDVHHLMDFMYMEGLACGRYELRLLCEGYLPFVARDLDLERPASRVVVEARLRLDPAMGKVGVKLIVPGQAGLGDLRPRLLLRALNTDRDEPSGWDWSRPREVDRDEGRVVLGPLRPGRYEVYAWAGADVVGRTEVSVVGGRTVQATVSLKPGLMVDLLQGGKLGPSEEPSLNRVDLVDRRGRSLPRVRFAHHQPLTQDDGGDPQRGGGGIGPLAPSNAVLGPIPVAEIRVTVRRDGVPRTWVVGSED